MSRKKIFSSIFTLLILAGCILTGVFWFETYEKKTTVVFLNVGQGDAILISQGSNQILIDGGRTGRDLLARVGRHIPFWDRTVEVVIATHPDTDHIGGFATLLGAYHVKQFLSTGAESKTDAFVLLKKALEDEGADKRVVFQGSSIEFPGGGKMTIEYPLAPLPAEMADTNSGSIVARFVYGETEILFTGDLPNEERIIPGSGQADVLKVSHHGSRYSTSALFLEQVRPQEAVISVGKNSYGHPSPDVLSRLEERNITIRRTDTSGDILYQCTKELRRCVFVE